ncbi:MAG: tetratricopeptide repeat protein, partial [Alphaproteobacteria bacterium]|nr:tetratricopeptide repeat protein [Alphaproteobacteria bacterium]
MSEHGREVGGSADELRLLQSRAEAARTRGDRAAAVAAFRELVARAPEQWRFAIGLAQELLAAGAVAEAIALLQRTVRRFPDEFWPAYHLAFNAKRLRQLDLAEAQARRLLDRFAEDHRAHELVGDMAVVQRDFGAAAAHYRLALERKPDSAALEEKLGTARLYDRVTRRMAARRRGAEGAADYGAAVINLDRSKDRLDAVTAAFRDCPAPPIRVPAVPGSALPRLVPKLLGHAERPPRLGSLGVFLSQVAGWQLMLDRGFSRWLMLEDDAVPLVDLPASTGDLGIPADFDLCFVNLRMQRRLSPAERDRVEAFQVFAPIDALLTFPAEFRAPGSDGYFISANGAKKLLAYIERDGFASFLD